MKYDFECEECGNKEEKSIPMESYSEEKDNQICSKCGGKMKRIFEGDISGVKYNCSGFYDTGRGTRFRN